MKIRGPLPRRVFGIAFGVDILEGRAERLPYCQRRRRFGGDQDQLVGLPFDFQLRQFIDLPVELGEVLRNK